MSLPPSSFVFERISHWAGHRPDQTALTDEQGQSISFAELLTLVKQVGRKCASLDLGPATPVLIYLPHGWSKAVCLSALLSNGLPGVAVSTKSPCAELIQTARQYPFQALIITRALAARVLREDNSWRVAPPDGFLNDDGSTVILLRNPEQRPVSLDFAWLLMTSGSTGRPKAVQLSWTNLRKRTEGEIRLFSIAPGDTILNFLSFAHDLGLNQLLCALCAGATLSIQANLLPVDLLSRLRTHPYSGFSATPLVLSNLLKLSRAHPPVPEFKGYLTISGGSLPPDQIVRLKTFFPQARIIKTYGQTETFRTLAECRPEIITANSCGQAIEGVSPLVVNDAKRACQVGEIGELVHFGEGCMSGYWLDPELTAKKMIPRRALAGDGQDLTPGVLTGDYFEVLAEGEYRYVGRRDDLVKRMDHRIYLSEIESSIRECKWVSGICVIAHPGKNRWGTEDGKLIAFVESDWPESQILPELEKFCFNHLAPYKVPDEFHVVRSIPATASNKPDRRELLRSVGLAIESDALRGLTS